MLVHLSEGLHYEGLIDSQVLQHQGQGHGLLVLYDLHDTGRGTPNGKKNPLFHKICHKDKQYCSQLASEMCKSL